MYQVFLSLVLLVFTIPCLTTVTKEYDACYLYHQLSEQRDKYVKFFLLDNGYVSIVFERKKTMMGKVSTYGITCL